MVNDPPRALVCKPIMAPKEEHINHEAGLDVLYMSQRQPGGSFGSPPEVRYGTITARVHPPSHVFSTSVGYRGGDL